MGENAFVAYTVVGVLVIPGRRRWVSVFISGVLFTTDGAGCLRLQSREECV
jgi:xanthine/uracil/vitamin C permease (AzgA family)